MTRQCGTCDVCCTVFAVPDLNKDPRKPCKYLANAWADTPGCTIHKEPHRPDICGTYKCEWLRGAGEEWERPDKSGIVVSINDFDGSGNIFAYVSETRPGAAKSELGEVALIGIALQLVPYKIPLIVTNYESKPPNDRGDYCIVANDLLNCTQALRGDLIGYLDEISCLVGAYEIVFTIPGEVV